MAPTSSGAVSKSVPSRSKKMAFILLNCESYKDEKEKIEFATPLHELIVNNDTLRTYAIGGLNETTKEKEENFTVKRMHAT